MNTNYIPVILNFDDLAVAMDTQGKLRYAALPVELSIPGEGIPWRDTHSIANLSLEQQAAICAAVQALPPQQLALLLTGGEE